MTVESAQMLASALIRHGCPTSELPLTQKRTPYKGGYPNHPSTIWSGDTRENYRWLCLHGLALAYEYEERYQQKNKPRLNHGCKQPIKHMCGLIKYIPKGELTPFARAINKDDYPILNDENVWPNAVLAYRAFYMLDKKRFATWGGDRTPPAWWNPNFTLEVIQ
tara:strand:- start:42 stop:533 length:492 start_codon:yes stop_codon:yes gene_type:complete